jgi:hypothetical protein
VASSRDELTPAQEPSKATSASSRGGQVLSEFVPINEVRGQWQFEFATRVGELMSLPPDWDSYGAAQLQREPARRLHELLIELDSFIQSAPSFSMTGAGGITCSWQHAGRQLDITAEPHQETTVYYWDETSNSEWDGPVSQAVNRLVKWVWQASSTY